MIRAFSRFAYRLLGAWIHRRREQFEPLSEEMRKARLGIPLEEYVAAVILGTAVLFIVLLPLSYIFFAIVYAYPLPFAVVSAIIISSTVAILFFVFAMNYPILRARSRGENIDAHLPHAVIHMATLAGTGTPPIVMFKAITRMKEYGEISTECASIVRDVEVFGKDLFTALADAARRSPSKHWAELLWGIITTLRTGGNLRQFLSDKAEEFVHVAEQEERKAMEFLSLISEIYMVVFILAPIMGVLMVSLMGFFGGLTLGMSPRTLLALLVYFALPLTGAVFIILATVGKPKEVF